jgi:queuine/archaeosine tRNA-ribosyltransferase
MLTPMFASLHNRHHDVNRLREMREALDAGIFETFQACFETDRSNRIDQSAPPTT